LGGGVIRLATDRLPQPTVLRVPGREFRERHLRRPRLQDGHRRGFACTEGNPLAAPTAFIPSL
jgi:hypothetical protein